MNELKFYAVDDCKVTHPRSAAGSARYVGFDPNTGAKLTKPDAIPDDGSTRVEAIVNEVRRDKCLTPADDYTAKRCGLPLPTKASAASTPETTTAASKGSK